jgi:hypothetical protein
LKILVILFYVWSFEYSKPSGEPVPPPWLLEEHEVEPEPWNEPEVIPLNVI